MDIKERSSNVNIQDLGYRFSKKNRYHYYNSIKNN